MTPLGWAGIILLLPFLIPVLILLFFWHIARALVLHALLLSFWAPRGRHILFVYSNSPNWKDYCELEILPQLPRTAAILNWSERRNWSRRALASYLFRVYAGRNEFNPIGIVFQPFTPIRIFRFWQPLRDAKHGRPQKLERLTAEFLEAARRQS